MRLAITSDIHIDKNGFDVLDALAERVRAVVPDVFIVAGDIATSPATLLRTLLTLRDAAPEMVAVAGNHDVWSPPQAVAQGIDAWARLDKLWPALCKEAGVHCLDAAPVRLGGVGFVGTMGWYDGTMRDEALGAPEEAYATGAWRGVQWMDHRLAVWAPSTAPEVAGLLRARLVAQLAAAAEDTIVAVTHVLPFADQLTPSTSPTWRFCSAFMGSTALGETLRADPRIRVAVAGHTHIASRHRFGDLQTIVSPLGYQREWRERTAEAAVARAVTVVEL